MKYVLAFVFLGVALLLNYDRFVSKPLPGVHENPQWANAIEKNEPKKINVLVPKGSIQDYKDRLMKWRKYTPLQGDRDDGIPMSYTTEIVDYWLHKFDWNKQVAYINTFNHYSVNIHGLNVHYIRASPDPSEKPEYVFPLLMIHGWPGSVYEFHKILPLLTKNVNGIAFEVIAPSLPGYGWSQTPTKPGCDQVAAAQMFIELMEKKLKFPSFYVQGGDWGSVVGNIISTMRPDLVLGYHTNFFTGFPNNLREALHYGLGFALPSFIAGAADAHKLDFKRYMYIMLAETGYFHEQATKPDTLGLGLEDSPVALAGWIIEKFRTWTDNDLANRITMDDLLTNVMIYWTNTHATSAIRFYREYVLSEHAQGWLRKRIEVPTAVACFPKEIGCLPKSLAYFLTDNLVHYSDMPEGGHFAALEVPHLLDRDVRKFVASNEKIFGFSDADH